MDKQFEKVKVFDGSKPSECRLWLEEVHALCIQTGRPFREIERSHNLDRSFRNIYIIPSFPTREQHAHSVQNARSRFTKLNQSYSC